MANLETTTSTKSELPSVRTRNRRGEGRRLREEIIAAALELLDETGEEHAITLRSVARRVGIAAPSIYTHFADQPAIMLAVVQQEFANLKEELLTALGHTSSDARSRLLTICHTYLEFAQQHPGRYRTMFGGTWIPDLTTSSLSEEDMVNLGESAMQLMIDVLDECRTAGVSTSTDVPADAVALWVGLHGLAHQRSVAPSFPWPTDIAERIIGALAHLSSEHA